MTAGTIPDDVEQHQVPPKEQTAIVDEPVRAPQVSRALAVVLSLLTVFGPISMDLYLPELPSLTEQLAANTSTAQLTITACLVGLALGQLVAGPMSDCYGRRAPLFIGVTLYVVTSLACAVSPTIEVLIVARFAQGLAGAVGIVIAQSAGRDIYEGSRLIRFYGRLTVLGGLAAVMGPVAGGQLARVTDWRGLFVFLALLGVVILVAVAACVRETLPPERRTSGGMRVTLRNFSTLLKDRVLVSAVVATGMLYAATFAYLSGATYVLQGTYGLSPQGYSYAFGLNSLGFMAFGYLGGRLSEWWSVELTLVVAMVMATSGAVGILFTGLASLSLAAIVCSLFVMVAGVSMAAAPATTLALTGYPEMAGTAASLLGVARFALGGVAAPLVGLTGADATVPLGAVALTCCAVAAGAVAVLFVARPPTPTAQDSPGLG